jgi:hypothetical protein
MKGGARSVSARLRATGKDVAGWGGAFAVILALLYAAGFLVVNAYLGTFGVRDLEPLRTRYVATGMSFLALTAVAMVFAGRAFDALAVFELGRPKLVQGFLVVMRTAVVVALVALLLISILASLGANTVPLADPASWARLRDVVTFAFATFIGVVAVRNRREDWHTTMGALIVLTSIGVFVRGLLAYANTIYPSVPPWFGGGRPDDVELVIDDSATVCPLCGPGPVKLLDDDANRVIVLVQAPDGGRHAVEISRADVRAIMHSPASQGR